MRGDRAGVTRGRLPCLQPVSPPQDKATHNPVWPSYTHPGDKGTDSLQTQERRRPSTRRLASRDPLELSASSPGTVCRRAPGYTYHAEPVFNPGWQIKEEEGAGSRFQAIFLYVLHKRKEQGSKWAGRGHGRGRREGFRALLACETCPQLPSA